MEGALQAQPWLVLLGVAAAWAALALAFLAVFSVAWVLLNLLFALVNGWMSLAARFPAPGPPEGDALFGHVSRVGPIGESRVTILHVSPAGLHLRTWFLFRPGRRPVLVPWSLVRAQPKTTLLGLTGAEVHLAGITRLHVTPWALAQMQPYLTPAVE